MNQRSVEELWQQLWEANELPYGVAQIAAVEQLLRHTDAAGDRELAFAARMLGTEAYHCGGETGKAFVTFSWCVADYDRDPAPHHEEYTHDLLWQYKWMVSALTRFPDVPLQRTYTVLDDMERRFREGGHSLHAVYNRRFEVARHVGDEAAADQWYERWVTAPRDELSDCAGCDPLDRVEFLVERGRDAEAVAIAEPVLTGQVTCNEQPQAILLALLVPYVRTGRIDDAAEAHRKAYRLIRDKVADLADIGEHIAFCARTGNEHRGLEILQRHLDWLDRAPSPCAAMEFAASGALLLRRLAAAGHGEVLVRRRAYGDRPAAEVPAATLAESLAAHASGLAAQFDARNGTTRQSRRIDAILTAEPFGVDVPLSPTARRRSAATPQGPVAGEPAAAPIAPEPTGAPVPADADPATLIRLAEDLERADAVQALVALLEQFDARFADADLPAPVAARRAELRAWQHWLGRDLAASIAASELAQRLYAQAGEPGRASRVSGSAGLARCLAGPLP
ncbi:MAG TPA: hypothetical protein VFO77_06670, partial [Actinoplanes sp.]|nr:hypothetical protein [Actinoplanes sp.]